MLILEYWLGKKAKEAVAKELGVSPLRVWQLSQKALSGMLAGLLEQPRRRVSPEIFEGRMEDSPQNLKKRVAELEKELAHTEDLVRILRTAPWASPASESSRKVRKKHGCKKKASKRQTSPPKRAHPDRVEPQATKM